MFHLFQKLLRKWGMLFFLKRRGSQARGDGLKREGSKVVTNYGNSIKIINKLPVNKIFHLQQ